MLGTGLTALGEEGAGWFEGFGTPAEIGRLLLTDFLLAFEVASILLLVAAVGAVDARAPPLRPGGPARDLRRRPAALAAEPGTLTDAERGTMLEAGGPPQR